MVGYVAGEWYDFEILVDLDASPKKYNITLSKDGSAIKTLSGIDFSTSANVAVNQISSLAWRNWGQDEAYIDNLSIELVEDEENAVEAGVLPLDDNFDGYTTVTGGSGSTDMAAVGYNQHNFSAGPITLGNVDNTQAVKFSTEGDSIRYNIADKYVPKSGKVKMAFSARYAEGANIVGPEFSDKANISGTEADVVAVQAHHGTIVVKELGASENPGLELLGSYTPDKWYDFVVIADLDSDTYDVQVSADGEILNQIFDIELVGFDKATTIDGIKYVGWRNWSTTGVNSYIDNLVIEETEEELPKVIRTDILDDDFNDYASVDDMTAVGYGKHVYGPNPITLETVDGDQAVKFSVFEDSLQYSFSPAVDASGKVKINYSGRYASGALIMGVEIKDSTGADGVIGLQVHGGTVTTYDQGTTAAKDTLLSSYTPDEWYDFEIILDFETLTYSLTASQDGKEVGRLENNSLYTMNGAKLKDIKHIAWRNWSGSSGPSYLDDLKVEYYITPPTISATKINTIDIFGNESEGMSNTISAHTKQLKLNFGTDLKAASLEGAVTLKTESGTEVAYTGKVDGKYYTMTFDTMLDSETKYVLTVASTVTNVYEKTLESNFTLNFSTGVGSSVAEISGLSVGNNPVTALSGLAAGNTLTVNTSYANASESTASLAWIIAYYSGDKLMYTESKVTGDIPAGKIGVEPAEFTVKDLTGVDEICVYLWNDTTSIKPYCEPAVLK